MKRSFLLKLQEFFKSFSSKPWASLETTGPDNMGRVEFSLSWNKVFVENLRNNGYAGMTEEETVQMFFLATQMIPESMLSDLDTVNPSATPNLTNEANTLRK